MKTFSHYFRQNFCLKQLASVEKYDLVVQPPGFLELWVSKSFSVTCAAFGIDLWESWGVCYSLDV